MSAKAVFAEQFRRLYIAAGDLPLRRIADAAANHPAAVRGRGSTPSAQRISDWKAGTNVPASFETLSPVLLVLIDRAKRTHAADPVLLDARRWRRMWEAAGKPDTTTPESADTHPLCPYLGLAAYTRADADWFFGRARPTRELAGMVATAATQGGLTMLVGASGAGKSSLLEAGLIPALSAADSAIPQAAEWPIATLTPGAKPLASLHDAIPCLKSVDDGGDGERVRAAVRAWAGATRGLIIVDQSEELFTVCEDETEREAFIAMLTAACAAEENGPPAVVIMGIRADFYARCLDYPELEDALQHRSLVLGPMRIAEVREAIARPARAAGLKLEPGLEDLVITDLCGIGGGVRRRETYDPGALPLLSHVLTGTWQHRRGGKLTVAGYRAAEGVAGSVAATADHVWAELDSSAQRAAKRILLRLVQVGDESRDSRRPRTRTELLDYVGDDRPAALEALEALTRSRLITVDAGTVTLTHEIVIDAWPTLRGWIDEDRTGNLVRQRLEADAQEWHSRGRDSGLLYRGSRLEAATQHGDATVHDISRTVGEFLDESTQTMRRAVRRNQATRTGLILLSVVAVIAAGIAAFNARQANSQRDQAIFGQVTAEADKVQTSDPSLSAQLNLVAAQLRPDDESVYTRLISTQNAPLARQLTGHMGAVYIVAFSPDSKTLASASYDNTVRLWDIADTAHPRQLATLQGHTSWVSSVAFSPDGRTLASSSDDNTVRLWDLTDRESVTELAVLNGHTATVFLAAFSPDGKTLATASFDETVRLWQVSDPRRAVPIGQPLTGSDGPVRAIAFSPDSATLASGGGDRTVRLWDVADPANARPLGQPLTGHTDVTHSLAFSPDGRMLASASDDRTVRLWNVTDRAAPTLIGQPFTGHTGPLWSVAFSSTGGTLVTGSLDGTAKLWNLADPAAPIQLGQTLAGTNGSIYSAVFAPNGESIASGGADGVVRLWSVPSSVLTGHAGRVSKTSFSGDGALLATGASDGTVQLWDMSDPAQSMLFGRMQDELRRSVFDLSLRPDGKILATGLNDGTLTLWSVGADGRLDRLGVPLTLGTRYVLHTVFSPDGQMLATSSTDESTQLWDVRDPANPRQVGDPIAGQSSWATAVAFSPNGKSIAVGSADHTVRLWDISEPGQPKPLGAPLTGHTGAVNAVAFSPDGTILASAGDDQMIRLWDVEDAGDPVPGAELSGHTSTVRSLSFSADGATLASAGDGQTVRIWDVEDSATATSIGDSLITPGTGRWYAAFSPAGPILAAGGDNSALAILDLDEDHAKDRICRYTNDLVNREQWAAHLPALDFAPPCTA
ncbi:WD40 repeat domain-containing protein [Antrihabitans sp. YC2-6]|uniref:nSTAND1 domain-containing NTPase n=1 Tax=Antrihabitans sp. YC2-6 TaxID=2799498 RepID=UPI0018F71501|nr:WD40 repeat domain-containing protein [Antrihabitans sp. YC2-6]MBJ8346499.1 WD40 repeat domain-containing protein [Antrihabitans sp. YC2-6]